MENHKSSSNKIILKNMKKEKKKKKEHINAHTYNTHSHTSISSELHQTRI